MTSNLARLAGLSVLLAAPLVACGTEAPVAPAADVGEEGAVPTSTTMASSLVASGFTVQEGKFAFLDMTACCATSCAGNNPSSPYGAFYVPPAPGATPEPEADAAGLSTTFRLRSDEAVVFVGQAPPEVRYFGFTPYLTDRANADGARRVVAASLSESLNQLTVRTAGRAGLPPFGKTMAIVAAADATTRKNAIDALVASGVPLSAINALVFDPTVARFEPGGDRFSVLFRVALPTDAAALKTWMGSPGASVYRLTPNSPVAANLLGAPAARPKDTTSSEASLGGAVDRLRAAILAAYPGYVATDVPVDDGVPDPQACIDGTAICAFDNRDTTYPATRPGVLFTSDADFYVAYGVDHQVTGKTSYANVSVYAIEHLVGLESVASPVYPGSAQKFLGADPDAPKLFAVKIARTCGTDALCMQVDKGACPSGIENGALGSIAFRTYLEPSSKTAPLPSTLVRDRILRFRKR